MRKTEGGGRLLSSITSYIVMALGFRASLMHSGTNELLFMKDLTILTLAKSHVASSIAAAEVLSVAKSGLDE